MTFCANIRMNVKMKDGSTEQVELFLRSMMTRNQKSVKEIKIRKTTAKEGFNKRKTYCVVTEVSAKKSQITCYARRRKGNWRQHILTRLLTTTMEETKEWEAKKRSKKNKLLYEVPPRKVKYSNIKRTAWRQSPNDGD